MKRRLVTGTLAASFVVGSMFAATPASALPTTTCSLPVDAFCRPVPCGGEDLDCAMIPLCVLWVQGRCVIE